jgi:hypothetical protein
MGLSISMILDFEFVGKQDRFNLDESGLAFTSKTITITDQNADRSSEKKRGSI